jgi:VWFA-related protein
MAMTNKRLTLCIVPGFWLFGGGLPAAWDAKAQSPEPRQTIKVKTELVEARVVVTDRSGRLVEGLQKEDFELLENNRPQQIAFFSAERTLAGDPAAPDRGRSMTLPKSPTEASGRTIVLVADTMHLPPSSLLAAKQALRRFVDESLTDRDLAAVVDSAGSTGPAGQFTREHRVLRLAIDRLALSSTTSESYFTPYLAALVQQGDPTALQVAVNITVAEGAIRADARTMSDFARAQAHMILSLSAYRRTALLGTLRAVCERLAAMPGLRLIVLVSDGFSLYDSRGSWDTSELQAVVSRAALSGVVIYATQAKGLQPPPSMPRGLLDPRIYGYISDGEAGALSVSRRNPGSEYPTHGDSSGLARSAGPLTPRAAPEQHPTCRPARQWRIRKDRR